MEEALAISGLSSTAEHDRVEISLCCGYEESDLNLFLNMAKLNKTDLIVGFDNSPISREAIIPFSTVGQQIDKIAYEAVNLLVELMNERKKRRQMLLFTYIKKTLDTAVSGEVFPRR